MTIDTKSSHRTLRDLKEELEKDFKSIDEKLVVLIDDIDRLPPQQICDVFQIVKNNGDFPKVTYVLAFDDAVVRCALREKYGELYDSFPEKIVQIAFTVPPPDHFILQSVFESELRSILGALPESATSLWHEKDFANYSFGFFSHCYSTLRDVKRILNGIRMNLPFLVRGNTVEMNPIDFVVVETIRVRFPVLYDFIKNNREVFTNNEMPRRLFPAAQDEKDYLLTRYKDGLEESVKDEGLRSVINGNLRELFPRLRMLSRDDVGSDSVVSDEYVRDMRICAERIFDRYFLYGNYAGDVSHELISRVVDSIHRPGKAVELLRHHFGKDTLFRIIEEIRIRANVVLHRDTNVSDYIVVVLDTSDHLPDDIDLSSIRYPLIRFIREALSGFDKHRRAELLQDACFRAQGMLPAVLVVDYFTRQPEKEGTDTFLDPELYEWLHKGIAQKGANWLREHDERCLGQRYLWLVLMKMTEWGATQPVTSFVDFVTREDHNLKVFLSRFLYVTRVVSTSDGVTTREYRILFKELDKLINLQDVYNRVLQLESSRTDDPEDVRLALEIFRRDYQRYQDGTLPDEPLLESIIH